MIGDQSTQKSCLPVCFGGGGGGGSYNLGTRIARTVSKKSKSSNLKSKYTNRYYVNRGTKNNKRPIVKYQ